MQFIISFLNFYHWKRKRKNKNKQQQPYQLPIQPTHTRRQLFRIRKTNYENDENATTLYQKNNSHQTTIRDNKIHVLH